MSRSVFFGVLLSCIVIQDGRGQPQPISKAQPSYILFLTADGFRSDYLEWYEPPNIGKLAAEGVRVLHAHSVFPTVTTPNMTALVTGSYPRTTGIASNSQYEKESDRIVESPRANHAETIAETLRKAGWKTGAVNQFMLANHQTDFYRAVGYDDAEKTTDAILDLITNKGVHFVAAIYGACDHAGHNYGPQSEQVAEAVAAIDKAIGRLMRGLYERGMLEQTLVVFSADHGMSAYEKKQVSSEPAKALREAGFIVATSQRDLKPDTQVIVLDAGVRIVYFRKELNELEKAKLMRTLSAIQGAEILEPAQLDALGCHPSRSGDLIVAPLPGYTMSRAGKAGGLHGRLSESNPILIFRGAGIRKGYTVEQARNIDIVPTILKAVQVEPAATVDGKALSDVLRNQADRAASAHP